VKLRLTELLAERGRTAYWLTKETGVQRRFAELTKCETDQELVFEKQ
jgi:hypothetical protein